jgi:hypothetical protein
MTVTLGARPDGLTVRLTTGADFIATLTNQSGDWAEGATITLVFSDTEETVWPATITGADAAFNVDKAIADTIPNRTKVDLKYTSGDIDQVWARGTVRRDA